jgi:hypothetical protein
VFVWKSESAVKIRHQTEWFSFKINMKYLAKLPVTKGNLQLSVEYPLQSVVPVRLSYFICLFAATRCRTLGTSNVSSNRKQTLQQHGTSYVLYSYTHIRWATFQFQYWIAMFVWVCRTADRRQTRAHTYSPRVLWSRAGRHKTFLKASNRISRNGLYIRVSEHYLMVVIGKRCLWSSINKHYAAKSCSYLSSVVVAKIRLTTEWSLCNMIVKSAVSGFATWVMSATVNCTPKFGYSFQLYIFQIRLT